MLGASAGDVIGSVYEGAPAPEKDFPLFGPRSTFTDDTVLTVAVASAIRSGVDYATALRRWGRRYPYAGYGGMFHDWLRRDNAGPYNSFGNGSAKRSNGLSCRRRQRYRMYLARVRPRSIGNALPEATVLFE
ncbi:MAG: hypothetical protein HWE39_01425 [Oceanospirillaceae bacterium]|nr:hypothetical protein [Oceanospirillaceae bacterium]